MLLLHIIRKQYTNRSSIFTQDQALFQDPKLSGTIVTSILHVLQVWLLIIALY